MRTKRVLQPSTYRNNQLVDGLRVMLADRQMKFYFAFLMFVLTLGVIGPYITPYEFDERHISADGGLARTEAPSLEHPLGTNDVGQDVLSRILHGARATAITGLLGGTMIITIGMSIGITAGYVGGKVDDVLMRFTDLVYGIPLLPAALVLIVFIGIGWLQSVIIIGAILWRGSARVLRSQVLQIKERPYVLAAKADGASSFRIVRKHILPNVATMAVLFFALGIGLSILIQAGLAFIGVTSPFVPTWGIMLQSAYYSGQMAGAWWWSLPPGFLISLTVLSTFMFGRRYEQLAGPTELEDEAFVQAG